MAMEVVVWCADLPLRERNGFGGKERNPEYSGVDLIRG